MEGNSWRGRRPSIKKYQSTLQSRSGQLNEALPLHSHLNLDDMFLGFEEIDMDDEIKEEFSCPYCSEYFDIVGLCCHIDEEHPMETKNGVCPVCAMRVGVDMVAHITLQHGNIFKAQRKRKSRKGGSHSTLSFLKKELGVENLQSILGGSSYLVSSSNTAPDPLLSSFILPMTDDFINDQTSFSTETSLTKKRSDDIISERKVQTPPMSIKEKEEREKRCEFVTGMLMSTIFDDDL